MLTSPARNAACTLTGFVVAIVGAVLAAQAGVTPPSLHGSMGPLRHDIRTSEPEAQRLFDQGLTLHYGFNRDGARRSFQRAAALDPEAPMPLVGVALALGPNLNTDPTAEEWQAACAASRAALRLATDRADDAYADALVRRYCESSPLDRPSAYVGAMRALRAAFPDDADAATLYAESLMLLRPRTTAQDAEIIAVLEGVLATHPDHPGAHHYYIHAVEGSATPERALTSAARLETLVPAIGHLVHMPSHIYLRTGDYARAMAVNITAAAVDRRYLEENPDDAGQDMYYLHDLESLAIAAGFAGRRAAALEAGRAASAHRPAAHRAGAHGRGTGWSTTLLFAQLRFASWQDALESPAPAADDAPSQLLYRFARTVALAALRDARAATAEQALFEHAAGAIPPTATYRGNSAAALLPVLRAVMAARIGGATGNQHAALAAWRQAVAMQDRLVYHETPPFYYPTRESLGAALVRLEHYDEAVRVFSDDLARNPGNGRSLFGRWQALRSLGHADADAARRAFRGVWAQADIDLDLADF